MHLFLRAFASYFGAENSICAGFDLVCWAEFLGLSISNDPYDKFSCIHGIHFSFFQTLHASRIELWTLPSFRKFFFCLY